MESPKRSKLTSTTTVGVKEKLIVALDVDTQQRAMHLVNALKDQVGMFKVGSQLFTSAGPDVVRTIVNSGNKVFLDLKFHDIPTTVASAAAEAARLGVSILNVHALGGHDMMQRTADAVSEVSMREGLERPDVIAVTVLTSADLETLQQVGISNTLEAETERLALLAKASGMDGVVTSPKEIALVREAVDNREFVIVTPGVRPAGSSQNDQKRVMTPAEAIIAGADYLVIGRPITKANDPVSAASAVVAEIESALK